MGLGPDHQTGANVLRNDATHDGGGGCGRPRRDASRRRRALDLADGRAASGPESRLRYVWQVEAGLPKPTVNVAVLDSSGAFAGIPDLLDEASGLVGEYDGGQHRELVQHTNDNAREERLESLGLVVVRATSVDLKSRRTQLIARMRSGYQRARGQHRRSWQI